MWMIPSCLMIHTKEPVQSDPPPTSRLAVCRSGRTAWGCSTRLLARGSGGLGRWESISGYIAACPTLGPWTLLSNGGGLCCLKSGRTPWAGAWFPVPASGALSWLAQYAHLGRQGLVLLDVVLLKTHGDALGHLQVLLQAAFRAGALNKTDRVTATWKRSGVLAKEPLHVLQLCSREYNLAKYWLTQGTINAKTRKIVLCVSTHKECIITVVRVSKAAHKAPVTLIIWY